MCDGSLYPAFEPCFLNPLTWRWMNEMDRLPLAVFPSLSLSKNNILYLNSKLYSDGTKLQKQQERKRTNILKNILNNILNNILHLHNKI